MTTKITSLELENVKKIKAVALSPSQNGLTVIGGDNGQGKTSVLDAIAWGLGGDFFKPSTPQRDGSVLPPHLKITLNNGLIVERKGKRSELKVTDPSGKRSGQQLLNELIGQMALDLPRFMQAKPKEKANYLLQVIGVGPQLAQLDSQEDKLYQERLLLGREADRKTKHAMELPEYQGVPEQPVSAQELISQQQAILLQNAQNQQARNRKAQLEADKARLMNELAMLNRQVMDRSRQLEEVTASLANAATADLLQDQSTQDLEARLDQIEDINRKVRANLDKQKALADAEALNTQYENFTKQIQNVRDERIALLNSAPLPLPGLTVEKGEIRYNGKEWDCMSGSEQLIVATAIVQKLNPNCGFVLLDKLEQLDLTTLKEFGSWLERNGLQAIATRVSKGDECSIIITDGTSEDKGIPLTSAASAYDWRNGF